MDALTVFGIAAVSSMLLFYALEPCGPVFVLGFAVASDVSAIYGFLVGAWPFGVVEIIWAVVAFHRWRLRVRAAAICY